MMTKDKLYDMVLDDWVHGDIYEPLSLIKDLIQLLEPEAVQKFAQLYQYDQEAV